MSVRCRYLQVKEILDQLQNFHRELSLFHESLGDEPVEERFQVLLVYMAKREQHLKRQLARFHEQDPSDVLWTWPQYVPEEPTRLLFAERRFAQGAAVGDVVQAALEFDEALIDLYRHLAESASAPRVQELFSHLLEIEESETMKFAWSVLEFDEE